MMTRNFGIILGVLLLSVNIASAQEDYNSLVPSLVGSGRCEGYPDRPEWTRLSPRELREQGYFLRQPVFRAYMNYSVRRAVIEADSCSCDITHPNWDERREELMSIVPGLMTRDSREMTDAEREQLRDAGNEYRDRASDILMAYIEICDRER